MRASRGTAVRHRASIHRDAEADQPRALAGGTDAGQTSAAGYTSRGPATAPFACSSRATQGYARAPPTSSAHDGVHFARSGEALACLPQTVYPFGIRARP